MEPDDVLFLSEDVSDSFRGVLYPILISATPFGWKKLKNVFNTHQYLENNLRRFRTPLIPLSICIFFLNILNFPRRY